MIGLTLETTSAAVDSQPSEEDRTPIQEKMRQTIQSVKGEANFANRLRQLMELGDYLSDQAKVNKSRAAIDYRVTLAPLLERKQKLANREACRDARMDLIFRVAGGSGFKGSLLC